MSYQLILLRHAEADDSDPMIRDIDRPLTRGGTSQAMRMGKMIKEVSGVPDLLLSSTALRARTTAEYIGEQLPYAAKKILYEEDVYQASLRLLLAVVNRLPDDKQKVLLVAHNPGVSHLAEHLCGDDIGMLPEAGAVGLQADVGSWQEVSSGLCQKEWALTV